VRNVHIAQEIGGNQFKISGGPTNTKVCWQVTGIRQDAWANASPNPRRGAQGRQRAGALLAPGAVWGRHGEAYGACPPCAAKTTVAVTSWGRTGLWVEVERVKICRKGPSPADPDQQTLIFQ
jgi:hypothetical protein